MLYKHYIELGIALFSMLENFKYITGTNISLWCAVNLGLWFQREREKERERKKWAF